MAFTKTFLQRSPTRVTLKVVATAQTDSTPIYLKTAVTTTTGNVTLTKPTTTYPGGTIVRASGSWLTDFTNANFVGGGGLNALGQYVYQITASPGSATNIKHFNIVGFATTSTANDTAIISQFTPVMFTEGPIAVTANSYYSDVITTGQTANAVTPSVYVNKVFASTTNAGGVVVTRNAVVALTLFGADGVYPLLGSIASPITENASSDLTVTWQTASANGGTAIIELSKIDGFSNVDVLGTTT